MKKLFLILFVCLLPAIAWGSPFVVCDPYTVGTVDYFKLTLDTGATQQVTLYGTPPYLHFDVGTVSVGAHTIKVKACKAATTWAAEVCSTEAVFTFTRPSVPVTPGVPTNIGLVP